MLTMWCWMWSDGAEDCDWLAVSASLSAVCAGLSCLQARPLRKLHSSAGLPCLARTKLGPAASQSADSGTAGHTGQPGHTGHQGNMETRGLTEAIINTCEELKVDKHLLFESSKERARYCFNFRLMYWDVFQIWWICTFNQSVFVYPFGVNISESAEILKVGAD